MDQAARGAAALSANKYDEAIQHYTSAIASNPKAVQYYVQRSAAYQRSSKYAEALVDAELAVALAHDRARRELIKDAQLRRGIALYFNERYADAEHIFAIVKKLDEKEKTLQIWTMKVAAKLKDLPEDDERRKVTVEDVPVVELPSGQTPAPAASVKSATPPAPKPVVPTPADKIKHDWYQDNEKVVFTLMAKGVPKDKATVDIDQDSLSISFPIVGSTSDYSLTLDPLYASVDPATSTYQVKSTKIEVVLKKAVPGVKWHTLESDRKIESSSENATTIPSHILQGNTAEAAPAYPTSSKTGAKNWDKLADADLGEEDDMDGDQTSQFFKKLYKGAGSDAQRAMMKSYQESGGTVLSTDWSQVGDKYVKPEPPEGMEAKTYDS